MENSNLKNIANIVSGIQSSFYTVIFGNQDKEENDAQIDEESILDCLGEYKRLCALILRADKKWKQGTLDDYADNKYFLNDYLFIYKEINVDLEYMQEHRAQCENFVDKFVELKFEIRNRF